MALRVRFFVPASVLKCRLSLNVACHRWLHRYDFSYPRVWGGCLFPFAEFGLFPMATRVRFFIPVNMEGWCLFFSWCVLLSMASWVRFFVPANMEGGVCSFLGVCYSQWLHGYDFSYPRVWGVLVLFSEFGLFPMATRVRFFVPVNMRGGLFSFGGVGSPMVLRVRFFVPASTGSACSLF